MRWSMLYNALQNASVWVIKEILFWWSVVVLQKLFYWLFFQFLTVYIIKQGGQNIWWHTVQTAKLYTTKQSNSENFAEKLM